MLAVTIKQKYKSINPCQFDLTDFCVLTGKNGSGKSHLLESISRLEAFSEIRTEGNIVKTIKYIEFNGLNPKLETDCQFIPLIQRPKQLFTTFQTNLQTRNVRERKLPLKNFLHEAYRADSLRDTRFLIDRVICSSSKETEYWNTSEEDFEKYYDYNIGDKSKTELFTSNLASIFKVYQIRLDQNQYNGYRNEKYNENRKILNLEEFKRFYGPKPWDLINDMMSNAKLPYRVNNPEGDDRNIDFHLQFTDPIRGISIQANDMSTGEKVLLSLAIAIYNTSEEAVKPDVLLLDEPDAALHPEFSKVLIDSIREQIVARSGVQVIMTTHSPSTVAMAPEESLYRMDREIGKPVKITKHMAISILTEGLSNLRVSAEHRRQVFVESKYDVEYYDKLYSLIPVVHSTQPCFLAPSTKSKDCTNCTDVIQIVEKLEELGNDLVYGLIDNDGNTQMRPRRIVTMGTRYSIENYIFDPIFIGFMLIRNNKGEELFPEITSYRKCSTCSPKEVQDLINAIVEKMGFSLKIQEKYQTISNQEFFIPSTFFHLQGHALEIKMLETWPCLLDLKRGQTREDVLKNAFLTTVITDFPEYLSIELKEVLNSFE